MGQHIFLPLFPLITLALCYFTLTNILHDGECVRRLEAHLDEQFDRKMLQLIGEEHVQAQRITLSRRLRPLFKAAAFVAFAIVLGTAVEQASSLSQGNTSQQDFRAAFEGEDELDATETTVIDIRSAIAEPADSTVNLSH